MKININLFKNVNSTAYNSDNNVEAATETCNLYSPNIQLIYARNSIIETFLSILLARILVGGGRETANQKKKQKRKETAGKKMKGRI